MSPFINIDESTHPYDSTTLNDLENINISIKNDDEDFDYDEEEIQQDAADETVALIVYIALAFFLFLFFIVFITVIIIVGKYGFLVFMIISILFTVVLLFARYLLNLMEEDRVLKPMKRKIRRWHAIATAVVVNEMKNFHLDINDHFLLTYDETYDDKCPSNDNSDGVKNRKQRKIPRSRIFRFIVQPLLKKKNGKRRFMNTKRGKKSSTCEESQGRYEPTLI